jgi:hypothetical protein
MKHLVKSNPIKQIVIHSFHGENDSVAMVLSVWLAKVFFPISGQIRKYECHGVCVVCIDSFKGNQRALNRYDNKTNKCT